MEAILRRIDPKMLNFAMAGVAVALAVLLSATLIYPKVKDYRTSIDARSLLQNVAMTSGSLEGRLESVAKEIEGLRHQLHGDMVNLPSKQLEAFIIGRLQEISWRNNIELSSVRPSKGQKVQIFQELLFEVEISGSYFDIFAWIQDLGDKLGFVVIKQYLIRPVASESAEPQLSVRLTMVSYRKG